MSQIRERAAAGIREGDVFVASRTFSEADMEAFARISRDYNPVHMEDRFARVKGFEGRICHGLLVASLLTEVGGQMGLLATGMRFRFRRPVYFGDTVTCRVTVVEIGKDGRARADVLYQNQHGDVVMDGEGTGHVPGERARAVLETMMTEGDPTNPLR